MNQVSAVEPGSRQGPFSSIGLTARARWSFARSCTMARFSAFLATLPACTSGPETCGSAHLGHRDRQAGHAVEVDRAGVRVPGQVATAKAFS